MEMFTGITTMLIVVIIEVFFIGGAMGVDLVSGIRKAKQRKEFRSSHGYKRTISKFILYYGSLFMATGIDSIMYLCRFYENVLNLSFLTYIPVISTLATIFILMVEWKSVVEKAEDKVKVEMSSTARILGSLVNKDELVEALTAAIKNAGKEDEK